MGKGLVVLVMAVLTGTAVLVHGSQRTAVESSHETSKYEGDILAREIARSAMNRAIGEARRNFAQAETIVYNDIPYQSGLYDVSSERLAASTVVLESVGRLGRHEYSIRTTLSQVSALDAVLNVDADKVAAAYHGNSFIVDGRDTNPPSAPSGGASVDNNKHGIHARTVAGRQAALDELSPGQHDQVAGVGGDADVVSGPFDTDFAALHDQAKASATETLTGGQINGNTTFGTSWQPEIVYVNDDLRINGSVRGYGVLVVDGDIHISGNLTWEGLVIARDDSGIDMDFTGGGEVYGAIVLVGSTGVEADFTIGGTARLYYSSEALGRLYSHLSTLNAAREIVIADQWQGQSR